MSYYESAEGITVTRARALKELDDHGVTSYDEFFADLGDHETYDAQAVLRFLGY